VNAILAILKKSGCNGKAYTPEQGNLGLPRYDMFHPPRYLTLRDVSAQAKMHDKGSVDCQRGFPCLLLRSNH
jgi:hypothetical protein